MKCFELNVLYVFYFGKRYIFIINSVNVRFNEIIM